MVNNLVIGIVSISIRSQTNILQLEIKFPKPLFALRSQSVILLVPKLDSNIRCFMRRYERSKNSPNVSFSEKRPIVQTFKREWFKSYWNEYYLIWNNYLNNKSLSLINALVTIVEIHFDHSSIDSINVEERESKNTSIGDNRESFRVVARVPFYPIFIEWVIFPLNLTEEPKKQLKIKWLNLRNKHLITSNNLILSLSVLSCCTNL